MRLIIRAFYSLLFIAAVSGCKSNISEQIIGKWKDDYNPNHFEILPSGIFIHTAEINNTQLHKGIYGKWHLKKEKGSDGKMLDCLVLIYPDGNQSIMKILSYTNDEINFESNLCSPPSWLRVKNK
jgi:hypothetical protein